MRFLHPQNQSDHDCGTYLRYGTVGTYLGTYGRYLPNGTVPGITLTMRLLLFGAIVQFIVKSSVSTNFTQCEDPGTNGVLASLRPHLYLICMLVATAEPLASHFVSHYATLGVPHVNMNMYVDTSQGAPAAHARILASARVHAHARPH